MHTCDIRHKKGLLQTNHIPRDRVLGVYPADRKPQRQNEITSLTSELINLLSLSLSLSLSVCVCVCVKHTPPKTCYMPATQASIIIYIKLVYKAIQLSVTYSNAKSNQVQLLYFPHLTCQSSTLESPVKNLLPRYCLARARARTHTHTLLFDILSGMAS